MSNPLIDKKFGTRFALIAFFLLCVGFYGIVHHWFAQKSKIIIDDDGKSMIFRVYDKHFYGEGSINGVPVVFLLDTRRKWYCHQRISC